MSRITTSNLATEVRVGSIDAEWTTEHTCFDGIPIERIACLYEALTGFIGTTLVCKFHPDSANSHKILVIEIVP